MKQNIIGLALALTLLSSLWGMIYNRTIFSPSPVAAHESLNKLRIPLDKPPVAQNDSYGVNKNSSLSVSASGVLGNDFDADGDPLIAVQISSPANGKLTTFNPNGSFTYKPNTNFSGTDSFIYNAEENFPGGETSQAQVTLYVRSVIFREDTDEITKGQCVDFTWLVRGDIDIIEFEVFDDNKNPFLVQQPSGNRQECPVRDSTYQLIVRWLDGTSNKEEKIDIEVKEADDGTGGGGTGGGIIVEGTVAPVGPFFLVTPIPITNAPGIALVPTAVSNGATKPTGALESVSVLPETGALPSSRETPVPNPLMLRPEGNSIPVQPYQNELWLMSVFGLGILLGVTGVGLTWLVRFLRQSD